ncbi:hypothetical protein FGB62_271g025 [Gracilaria domingensis]|nr:hypothetical protein FGB62_271g025 [Gracilaria domingensis]
MFIPFWLSTVLLCLISVAQCEVSAEYETSFLGAVDVLLNIHGTWPPDSIVPPSNITGLNQDHCFEHDDCKPPRLCLTPDEDFSGLCRHPPSSSSFGDSVCKTSTDCEEGEICLWDPLRGLVSGVCLSQRLAQGFANPVLKEPLALPSRTNGRTGDRCFLQSDCSGERSCVTVLRARGATRRFLATPAQTKHTCVCAPLTFIRCSSIDDCNDPVEICASVTSNLESNSNSGALIMLPPLCLSAALARNQNVTLVSDLSSNFSALNISTENISYPREQNDTTFNASELSTARPAFSVPAVSVFNSFTTNEIINDYIVGMLSLIILSQIRNILSGIIYATPGIHQRGYSSYIVFSRLLSFRHLFSLITGREPYTQHGSTSLNVLKPGVNFRLALLPFLALTMLYVVELATIVFGSQLRQNYSAEQYFDPVLSIVKEIPRPRARRNENCDDFFVPTRGLQMRGEVLKCVEVSTDKWDLLPYKNLIQFSVSINPTWTSVHIFDQHGESSAVEVSTYIVSVSGNRFQTIPIHLDKMSDIRRKQFLNGFLNGVRLRLGKDPLHPDLTLWSPSRDIVASIYGHVHGWNDSTISITNAVISELRQMDLALNSSGMPWVFESPDIIKQMNPWMAVVRSPWIAHSWLLILAAVVTTVNVIMNTFATHFDEVAYTAMKEIIGDVSVLGPLADYKSVPPVPDIGTIQL